MADRVIGFFILLAGCALVVFRQHFAKWSMESQNQTWGFKFGDREVRGSAMLCAFFGALVAVVGLMFMAGLINFR